MFCHSLLTKITLLRRKENKGLFVNYTPIPIEHKDHSRLSVRYYDSLSTAVEKFHEHMTMRLLTVVDEVGKPIGVIREDDIRGLLYNPFGHALMSNPGFGNDISGLIFPCAVAEHDLGQAEIVARHAEQPDSPGLILTYQGKFLEALSNDQLIALMVEARLERAEHISKGGERFTGEILTLSNQLSDTARRVYDLAESLHLEAQSLADSAQNVALGAEQSSMGLQDVNERGRHLAAALENLGAVALEAKQIRSRTRNVIDAAAPNMQALADSGAAISDIIEVIQNVVRRTNFLALNAQIEAARQDAGAAGFVAVAGEIKQLVKQTRGSVDQVSEKADQIDRTVSDVLGGHQEIVVAMDQISKISNQIDISVEQQSATGLAIAGFVEQAAIATSDIAIRASDIGGRADQLQSKAKQLERVSESLLSSASDISARSRAFVISLQAA